MIEPLLAIDTFVVISKTSLNDQNHRILTLLYQPIIGSIAISLYLSLWRYVDNFSSLDYMHSDLVNIMQLRLEEIKDAREKLEALGLLKTYLKKDEISKYVYELYNPLNENEFISNPILNTALYNNLTKKEYKRIIDSMSIPKINLGDYKDISVSFSKIYGFKSSSTLDTPNIRKISHLDLDYEPTVSLNEIFSLISDECIKLNTICKTTRDLIYKLSFVYNLDDSKMREVILNSIVGKKIDLDLLKENSRNYYKFENDGMVPKIVLETKPTTFKTTNQDSKKGMLIAQFESVHPYDFLALKQGTDRPIKSDLELIEFLLIELETSPGVVNVLIDYVLKINSNKLTRKFVEQIATQWKRSGIKTVSEALDFAKEEYNKRTKVKETKVVFEQKKEEVTTPSWFKDNNNVEDEIATDEEILAFERMLMNL